MARRLCLVLPAALVLVGVWAAPADAHVELEAATPPAGAVLTSPPASLSLTFSTTPVSVGVDVTAPDGGTVAVGELGRQGATVVVPLPDLEQQGTYTVSWRAANDAHPFTGSYTFGLHLGTTSTDPPGTTTSAAPADAVPAATSGDRSSGSGPAAAAVAVGALVVAAAGALLIAARSRARRRRPTAVVP